MKRMVASFAAVLLAATAGHAQEAGPGARPAGTIGDLVHAGTGCPAGTVEWATSPDRSAIVMLFTAYEIVRETGGLSRLACNLAIPVAVPPGLRIAVLPVDFAGRHRLAPGARAMLAVESFMAGAQGIRRELTLSAPDSGTFFLRQEIPDEEMIWSGCGQDVILRVNTSVLLTGAGSLAVDAGLAYRLRWETCEQP